MKRLTACLLVLMLLTSCTVRRLGRESIDLTADWRFMLGDSLPAFRTDFPDSTWRMLNLPHDWSIESDFSEQHPATPGGGALPGGIGWYRKTFTLDKSCAGKCVYVDFDGVYRNSKVWINGHLLGERPNGYISFRYDLTPYVKVGASNVLAVRVDNSKQPNSRWYSGSGIYRNVRLVLTHPVHVDLWGTCVTTPQVSTASAKVQVRTTVRNTLKKKVEVRVEQVLEDKSGREGGRCSNTVTVEADCTASLDQHLILGNPKLWRLNDPNLYTLTTRLFVDRKEMDEYTTPVGIRSLRVDAEKGFFLNGQSVKLNGVCLHHDLGALGAAVNTRALERQLQLLKAMGCNAIRTSHNPPAPELLTLCDKMGFVVMDEAFDMWLKSKNPYDYAADFSRWFERDLKDQVLRDRNHPCVVLWSIGNEVGEQWSTDTASAARLTRRLVGVVRSLDPTRPITAACNETGVRNPLLASGALDVVGFNYHQNEYEDVPKRFPGKPFVATESVSALMSRGVYMQPSTQTLLWPERWDKPFSHPSQQCSAYDQCHAPWGSSHEETWKIVKRNPHVMGQFIWTGFDYLGEPTPYGWPSRSSYFGIIDLAGFPKDIYYMYQSEWTKQDVLHLFPHWNWEPGHTVDVWAYYNHADEVELYLNGKSLGKKSKTGDDLHVMWSVRYQPGTLKAVSRRNGKVVLETEIHTAGKAAALRLTPDRKKIKADGKDLAYVTVEMVDSDGNVLPTDRTHVLFSIDGPGAIVGTDNGDPTEHASLKLPERNLFNGKCLVIVQSKNGSGTIRLKAFAPRLKDVTLELKSK
jgi:beta-galactosidase